MPVFELPKFTHPDFADPSRKPVGGVEIDENESLSDDLEVAAIFQNNAFDLIGKQLLSKAGTIADLSIGPDYVENTGASSATAFQHPPIEFDNTKEWSLSFECEVAPAAANDGLIFARINATTDYIWMREGAGIYIQYQNSYTLINTGTTSFIDKAWYTIVAETPGSPGTIKVYKNGVLDSTTSMKTGYYLEGIAGGYQNASYSFDGKVYNYFVHSRAINANQVAALHSKPYLSTLKPIEMPSYFTPDAAPPVGAIMNQIQTNNLGSDLYNGTFQ